ncbi:hypothetical protein SEMRO_618_G176340.1 [Seminavis robusta]|uniref:Uncharacterized protein n=1 Tax=Seminavis robusta TaxID=568900 RepID=A0A9N8HIE0_9STRA|nr:hypothetical protein SEMRO_618_G176340.1 [Seminavis robusta]|eukprot:Sro618_g176340.1 n/a (179) ;mRNA; r:53722-54258
MDASTEYSLRRCDKARLYRLEKSRRSDVKRKRKEVDQEKIREYIQMLREDKAAGTGYATGCAMDENGGGGVIVRCKRCKGVGHKTANSRLCRFFKPRKRKNDEAVESEVTGNQDVLLAGQANSTSVLDVEDTNVSMQTPEEHTTTTDDTFRVEIGFVDTIGLTSGEESTHDLSPENAV